MKKILVLIPLLFSLPTFASGVAACKVSVRTQKGAAVVLDLDVKTLGIAEAPAVNAPLVSSCPGSIAFSPSGSETLVYSIIRAEKQGSQVVCEYSTVVSQNGNNSNLLCLAN
jgi:hypothetical protein